MRKFKASAIFGCGTILGTMSMYLTAGEIPVASDGVTLNPEWCERLLKKQKDMLEFCGFFELPVSIASCQEIIAELEKTEPRLVVLQMLLVECGKRINAELKARCFLYVPFEHEKFYKEPFYKWDKTLLKRQAQAAFDIEEGSKCLATERNTGCVFHMMRLMELGLKDVTKELQITLDWHERSWEKMLTKIHDEIIARNKRNDPAWPVIRPFFEGAEASLNAVKVAWRNPTMHIEKQYDPERAGDIYQMVRVFMEHLYTTLN